jgi:hypothetical protein
MNRASKQSILCDEQEHLEIQRHKQQALTQNLQHHHHQPTPLGCESWALKEEDQRRIKVFHHRSLRRMLNITIYYDVMEQHISNDSVRQKMKSYPMKQTMELRHAQ